MSESEFDFVYSIIKSINSEGVDWFLVLETIEELSTKEVEHYVGFATLHCPDSIAVCNSLRLAKQVVLASGGQAATYYDGKSLPSQISF